MKTLKLKLQKDGNQIELDLRLTFAGQWALEEKYKEDTMTCLTTAATELKKTLDVLQEAANFKDNKNLITDAEEIYDLLVDNGYAGTEGFADLMINIGKVSGIFKEKQAGRLSDMFSKRVEAIFDAMENSLNEEIPNLEKTPLPAGEAKPE